MNVDIPPSPEPNATRIPELFRINNPLPLTTRRVNLETSRGHFRWAPSLENLLDVNDHLKRSFSGYCLICFPEKDIIYIMAPNNSETELLFTRLMAGDKEVALAFTENYVKRFKKLVSKDYRVGDGDKVITVFEWKDKDEN